MWVRFLKDTEGSHRGDVLWTDDDIVGQQLVDAGIVGRCLGPDGVSFGEGTPEDVQVQINAEEKIIEENS